MLQIIRDLEKPRNSKQDKTNIISIINVYAPTLERSEKDPEEKEKCYDQLSATIESLENKSILLIAGDFNAKIGKLQEGDAYTCVGKFSRGERTTNGQTLLELCEEKRLFVSNSAFNHPARHQTTWEGQTKKDKQTGKKKPIYNQIDFILCPKRFKHLLENARSYSGTSLSSDHRLVKTTIKIEQHRVWKKGQNKTTQKRNIPCLNTEDGQRKYRHELDTKLLNLTKAAPYTEQCATDKLKDVKTIIIEAGKANVGPCKNNKHTKNYDHELSRLSKEQKDLRIRIQNTENTDEKSTLKTKRNKILHRIRHRQIKLNNEEIDRKIEGIHSFKNDHAMFKATRLLNQKTFENPKVEDLEGNLATRPGVILDIVSKYFKDKFADSRQDVIPPFQGAAKPLRNKITAEEVRRSFKSLSNYKAPGEDNINGELLKHGTPLLDKTIADIYNTAFEKHEDLDINGGILIAIQNPAKGRVHQATCTQSHC